MFVFYFNHSITMSFDATLQHSFNCVIAGPSRSGKTTLLKNILQERHTLFSEVPEKVFLFYSHKQPIYDAMLREGLIDELTDISIAYPSFDYLFQLAQPYKHGRGCLFILDDIISDLSNDFMKIFCNLSHHEKASIILMSQNLFHNHKAYRTLSINTHYLFLMKQTRDVTQISNLGRQACAGKPNFLPSVYKENLLRPYSYVLLDFGANQDDQIRVRNHMLPNELPIHVFVPN